MKTVILVLVAVILLLAGVGIITRFSRVDIVTQYVPTTSSPTATLGKTTISIQRSAFLPKTDAMNWDDVPILIGAVKIQQGTQSMSIPSTAGNYSKTEWRYYSTDDNIDKVVAFYKSQLQSKGWTEEGWTEMINQPQAMTGSYGYSYGYYSKNENDVLMVYVQSQY